MYYNKEDRKHEKQQFVFCLFKLLKQYLVPVIMF